MKQAFFLLSGIALCILLQSHGNPQEGVRKNTGEIVYAVDYSRFPCLYRPIGKLSQLVIRNSSEYSTFCGQLSRLSSPESDSCQFPQIDFDKYTLLAYYGGGNSYCSVEYARDVKSDPSEMKCVYTLTVYQSGYCKSMVQWLWHIVLIPKIGTDYFVEFKTDLKRV